MDNFHVIDIETANADVSSICQIGVAEFQNGEVVNTWKTLVDPQDCFDGFNVRLHGISEETVKGAPTFEQIHEDLTELLRDKVVVHHMPFDRVGISRACEECELDHIPTFWLDSARVVRRTWEQFAYSGYGLKNIADFLEIKFEHHDALEDAIATGRIMLKAMELTSMNIDAWRNRVNLPINLYATRNKISTKIKLEGNPEGPLFGENMVFTGKLCITRAEAGKIAAQLGCNVDDSLTQKTTILVLGAQDDYRLAGHSKSSKHRKAEKLIEKGCNIQFLTEADFLALCG